MTRPYLIAAIVLSLCIGGSAAYVLQSDAHLYGGLDAFSEVKDLPPTNPAVLAYWTNVIKEDGGVDAYRQFDAAYGRVGTAAQHERAHIFGEALYKVEGIPGVTVCNANYGFGCYHAFFGWALLENGLDILEDLDQACIDAYGRRGLGCQHGIGHGVIAELGYDQLDSSLEACMRLDWQGPIGGCTSGVFMEYNFATMQQTGMRDVDERGLFYPCESVEERFTEACYFEQPAWWNAQFPENYTRIGALCGDVSVRVDREACFRGTGNVIAGLGEYEIDEILDLCGSMPDREGEMLCIEGAVWITSNQPQFENDWERLCNSLDDEYYRRCIESHDLI